MLLVGFLCCNTEKTAQTKQNKIQRLQQHFRRKRYTAPILLYHNHTATFQLELSGDIETNPGPISCNLCEKTVRKNSRQLHCSTCKESSHVKCHKNISLTINTVQKVTVWTCHRCLCSVLPFHNTRTIDETPADSQAVDDLIDQHLTTLDANRNRISIAHLNTQSIASSFAEFEAMLTRYKFDIMTLSETWLKENVLLLQHVTIPGYHIEYINRPNRRGGGVGLYIKDHLKFKVRTDINQHDTTIEHLWIEVKNARNVSFLVGVFYQPSSVNADKEVWVDKIDTLLSHVTTSWNETIVIAGDTNIDISKETVVSKKYLQILEHHGMKQHIEKPTRKGSKLIDHISSNLDKIIDNNVLPCDEISDHDAPYVILNIRKQRFEPRFKMIRNEKNFDTESFLADVSMLPFTAVYAVECPDEQLDIFNEIFLSCLEEHAPLVKQKVTRPPAPWLKDLNVENEKNRKNLLRNIAQTSNSETDLIEYRKSRNNVKKLIKSTKSNFYKKALSSKRPKGVWNTINRILHPNPQRISADPDVINQFFNTTAKRLLGSNPKPEHLLREHIDTLPDTDTMLHFNPVTYNDVRKAILSVRQDCSTGHDNIPSKYLKMSIDFIVSPVCHIINQCIQSNHFPNQWKISRISPIPKISNPNEPSDFRPISILPILSKVYERLIMHQMVSFLETQRVLSEQQSGFRKGYCTVTTCLKIRDDILKAMDRGEVTLSVMADYSKAFDTVDYQTLISKLHKAGFSKNAKFLLCSYLSNRTQYVQIDCNSSNQLLVTNGVPQGSILGPILFNIYVHDLNENTKGTCLQYADDTNMYESFKPTDIIQKVQLVNDDLNQVAEYSSGINLIFNAAKTKTVLFGTRQMLRTRHLNDPDLYGISVNGNPIERAYSYKILGITFSHDLSWNLHSNQALKSSYATLRLLSRIKKLTPFHIRKQLAESLVLSKIDYGNAVIHDAPDYIKNQMQKVVNASAGYVRGRYSRTTDSLNLKWLPVPERSELSLAKLAWKSVNSPNWPRFLPMEKNLHTRTRRGHAPNTIKCTTNLRSTFEYTGASIFNSLPAACRECDTYGMFCNMTKKYFLDKALARCLA